jgi:hypothetical protein
VREPDEPRDLASQSFLLFGPSKGENQGITARPLAQGGITEILEGIRNISQLETQNMDIASLLPVIMAISQKQKTIGDGGDFPTWILPILAANKAESQSKGIGLGDVIDVVRILTKSSAPASQDKLFGIDDAILIPAVTSVITAAINKKSAGQQKFLGIDDAIIGPLIIAALNR